MKMDDSSEVAAALPFGDIVCMMSALLEPSFCLFWLEQDIHAPDEVKNEVKEIIGRGTHHFQTQTNTHIT